MIKSTIKYLLLLLPIITFGQNRTYIGAEIGPKFEVYRYMDSGDGLYTKPFFYSPIYGFTIGQGLNKNFMFEAGFYVNDYGESYRIKGDNGYGSSNALIAYQIPLRLKSRLNLIKQRLHLVATVGYTLGINSEYGSYGSGSSFSISSHPEYNDSTRTQDLSSYSLRKTYGLIETGLSLDYTFKNLATVYLAANYLTGLNRIVETHVRYWINDQPEQRGTVFSNGNYYSITIGARYPISNLWTKKPD